MIFMSGEYDLLIKIHDQWSSSIKSHDLATILVFLKRSYVVPHLCKVYRQSLTVSGFVTGGSFDPPPPRLFDIKKPWLFRVNQRENELFELSRDTNKEELKIRKNNIPLQ